MTFRELTGERTRKGKKFQDDLDSRKYALDLSIGAVHYGGPDWKDIDNRIVPSVANIPELGLADYEMVKDDFEWFARGMLNTVPLILYRNRTVPGSYITFNPQALQWTNDLDQISQVAMPETSGIVAQVSGRELRWPDAYGPGRDLSYLLGPNRMAKQLTLSTYPGDPPPFIIDGGHPVLELRFIFGLPSGPDEPDIYVDGTLWNKNVRVSSGQEIEFRVSDQTIFWFAHPIASDNEDDAAALTMVLEKQGPNLEVGIRVPLAWLQTAIYPVTIDPTLDLQVSANLDDADERESDGLMDTAGPVVDCFANAVASSRQWSGFRFVDSSIVQNDTIDVCFAELFQTTASRDDADLFFHFEDAASPIAFTSTTNDIQNRTRTAASVAWDEDNLGSGAFSQTPSLVTPLQEVVDDFAPTAFVLIGRPNTIEQKRLRSRSHDNTPAEAAKLHIEFTAGVAIGAPEFMAAVRPGIERSPRLVLPSARGVETRTQEAVVSFVTRPEWDPRLPEAETFASYSRLDYTVSITAPQFMAAIRPGIERNPRQVLPAVTLSRSRSESFVAWKTRPEWGPLIPEAETFASYTRLDYTAPAQFMAAIRPGIERAKSLIIPQAKLEAAGTAFVSWMTRRAWDPRLPEAETFASYSRLDYQSIFARFMAAIRPGIERNVRQVLPAIAVTRTRTEAFVAWKTRPAWGPLIPEGETFASYTRLDYTIAAASPQFMAAIRPGIERFVRLVLPASNLSHSLRNAFIAWKTRPGWDPRLPEAETFASYSRLDYAVSVNVSEFMAAIRPGIERNVRTMLPSIWMRITSQNAFVAWKTRPEWLARPTGLNVETDASYARLDYDVSVALEEAQRVFIEAEHDI